MSDDYSHFGRLRIDTQEPIEGWEGSMPPLIPWRLRNGIIDLDPRQREFYKFVKAKVYEGVKLPDYVQPYLSLLTEETKKLMTKVKNREMVVKCYKNLYQLYNMSNFEIEKVLESENSRLRSLRIHKFKRNTPARWIAPGEKCEVDGEVLTRGGFYLGQYVNLNKFSASRQEFIKKVTPIEGPVVNLNKEDKRTVDNTICIEPTTFLELNDTVQQNLITWLKGEDITDKAALKYYLAGLEFRLLADADTTQEERIEILRYLYDLYLYQIPKMHLNYATAILTGIINMIDMTLARYFTDNPCDVFEPQVIDFKNKLERARVYKALDENEGLSTDKIVEIATETLLVPSVLPKYYEMAYKDRLRKEIEYALSKPVPYANPHRAYYESIFSIFGEERTKALNSEALVYTNVNRTTVDKIMNSYMVLNNELRPFFNARAQGYSPLVQARLLPIWLDTSQLEGVKELIQDIRPSKDEAFKTVELRKLLDTVGIAYGEEINYDAITLLDSQLQGLGLKLGCWISKSMKYKVVDTVTVYESKHGELPSRGTQFISLVLYAWMLTASDVKDSEIALGEEWIKEKDTAVVPSMAMLHWLLGRKIMMTAKRKAKAAMFKRFTKLRGEFINFLLSVVANPEIGTPKRMKRLESIYTLVGLDASTIHSDLHRLATVATNNKAKKVSTTASGATIDKNMLKNIAKDTEKAQAILSDVFDIKTEDMSGPQQQAAEKSGKENPTIEILRLLNKKEEWSREEFEQLASKYKETAGSMLERLNDYAYEHVDEAVAEDDEDIIYIDTDVIYRLLK